MKVLLTAFWGAVLFISSLPAAAIPLRDDTRSVTINYSDLNLAKPAGVRTLKRRVRGAIRQVCNDGDFTIQQTMAQHECAAKAGAQGQQGIEDAVSRARQQPDWSQSTSQFPAWHDDIAPKYR